MPGTHFAIYSLMGMKIAIPLFGDRVSPRFDVSPEVWFIEVEGGEILQEERFPTENLTIPQRLERIASSGVHKVICGGIDGFCRDQLGNRGVDVVQDITGDAGVAFDLFMKGTLRPGFCCEKKGRRHRCPWRREFPERNT
jgi:predicted Fe-Mo cluster-binding NifX family protein